MQPVKASISHIDSGSFRIHAGSKQIVLANRTIAPYEVLFWRDVFIVLFRSGDSIPPHNLSGFDGTGKELWTLTAPLSIRGQKVPWDAIWIPFRETDQVYFGTDADHIFELLNPQTGELKDLGYNKMKN